MAQDCCSPEPLSANRITSSIATGAESNMAYLDFMELEGGFIPPALAREKGKELHEQYTHADPFPSIVLDDFLPTSLADVMLQNFGPARQDDDLNKAYDTSYERLKSSYHPDTLNAKARGLFYSFNSRPFLQVLENISGIKGLIPDPYFLGGGFHEIRNGGHLSVHADFNHHKMMNLERRINVLIYLNKDWKNEYGGQLELWETGMSRISRSILPEFNRCVIFNTTEGSMHGNPQKVSHPDGISRKSIALYYYTSTWDGAKKAKTTQFHTRPGTEDRPNRRAKAIQLAQDWLPPVAMRTVERMRKTIKR
jgi:Rps23 Pro-64 3,4-dihydroxylase Tpa1-like proline 4-hydroxylase